MSVQPIQIKPVNVRQASQQEYEQINIVKNCLRAERLPDDPPVPLDEHIQGFQNLPPFLDFSNWVAYAPDGRTIVALGEAVVARLEENQHLGQMMIEVLPEYRRQGLARKLLALIAGVMLRESRRLIITETSGRIPAGEAFMKALGASAGLQAHTNQLVLADLDRDLVSEWIGRAAERAAGFELGFWDGPYPEDQLEAVSVLMEVMNQQPMGDLEVEDQHYSAKELRQIEQMQFSRGYQRWTLYARAQETGQLAGFTDVLWNPNRPEVLQQGNTGVFPQYRNKGLGRWLKAAMLDKVLRERAQVKFIRTGNADANEPMLKINNELGFKPYMSQTLWQVETQKVQEYLEDSA